MSTVFLEALKGRAQAKLDFGEVYEVFRTTLPDQYMHSDGGLSALKRLLEELKGLGEVRFSNAPAKSVLKGRHSFPSEIALKRDPKPKKEKAVRQWDYRILSATIGADPRREAFLIKLDSFLKQMPKDLPVLPIKARSLQIFGDEKELGKRMADKRTGKVLKDLTLDDLRCYIPRAFFLFTELVPSQSKRVLIVENSETFYVLKERNRQTLEWCALVYGAGNAFIKNGPFLDDLRTITGAEEFFYFGDIDIPGFDIPMKAQQVLTEYGSDIVLKPHLDHYRDCLVKGLPAPTDYKRLFPWERNQPCDIRTWTHDWFLEARSIYEAVDSVVLQARRIAQEWIAC